MLMPPTLTPTPGLMRACQRLEAPLRAAPVQAAAGARGAATGPSHLPFSAAFNRQADLCVFTAFGFRAPARFPAYRVSSEALCTRTSMHGTHSISSTVVRISHKGYVRSMLHKREHVASTRARLLFAPSSSFLL